MVSTRVGRKTPFGRLQALPKDAKAITRWEIEPEKLRQLDDESLERLLEEILALPAQPSAEAFVGAARRRAELVRAEIARRDSPHPVR